MKILYQGRDHCQRPWLVVVDIPQPKDPPRSTRVWFNAEMADRSRNYIDNTSLWHPEAGWSGAWVPTNPRSVPPAIRAAAEAALQQLQEVA